MASAEHFIDGGDSRSSLDLLKMQRSHILVVLSDAKKGCEGPFLKWYADHYRKIVIEKNSVLNVTLYERDDVDITLGNFARPPTRYLSLCEVAYDGAEAAEALIEEITALHHAEESARMPATWLYFAVSEKVGRSPTKAPSRLTVAFANGIVGQETAFREWYITRHIRHALNIPALVSGQCFERTEFQRPGELGVTYSLMAVYEQEGTAESIIDSFKFLSPEIFRFPTLDLGRFAESSYKPL